MSSKDPVRVRSDESLPQLSAATTRSTSPNEEKQQEAVFAKPQFPASFIQRQQQQQPVKKYHPYLQAQIQQQQRRYSQPLPQNIQKPLPQQQLTQQHQVVPQVYSSYAIRVRELSNALWWSPNWEQRPDSMKPHGEVKQRDLSETQQKRRNKFRSNTLRRDMRKSQLAELEDELVPIRIDFEVEGTKIKDVMTWNLNDTTITPKQFSEIYVQDMQIAPIYVSIVADIIQMQLMEYERSKHEAMLEHGLVPIRIELQVGKVAVKDRFLWDVSDDNPVKAEEFARVFTEELGLGGEYQVIIAHAIREQIQAQLSEFHTVSLHLENTADVVRTDDKLIRSYTPSVQLMSEEQLTEFMKSHERNTRRLRRESSKSLRQFRRY